MIYEMVEGRHMDDPWDDGGVGTLMIYEMKVG